MFIEVPYTKNPADQDTLAFRYDWLINNPTYAGYALDSYTFRVFDVQDIEYPEMIIVPPTNDDKFIWVTIGGGTDLQDFYLMGEIIFKKAGSPDFRKEWEVMIQVRQEGI